MREALFLAKCVSCVPEKRAIQRPREKDRCVQHNEHIGGEQKEREPVMMKPQVQTKKHQDYTIHNIDGPNLVGSRNEEHNEDENPVLVH